MKEINPPGARIKVIGVGGGGGNAVDTMIRSHLEGVEFVAANTDVQSLRLALPDAKIQLGKELTKGLGAGADPDVGRDAALEDRHEIQEAIGEADMVFITAGMGGGTGTGGASVIAQIAREMGALTVGVVTKPFHFEGKRRRKHAELGIERLRENVDTLITIPNQKLLQIATPDMSMMDAFNLADEVLVNAVKGISDIINIPGIVNVDFADVKAVMSSMGMALMGIGEANGEGRAIEAARKAISSPLLEDIDIEGATGILINITAAAGIGLMEVNEACSVIQEAAHEDANIIFGTVIDEELGDSIRVTVIATGFPADYADIVDDPNPTFKKQIKNPVEKAPPAPKAEPVQRAQSSASFSEPYQSSLERVAQEARFDGAKSEEEKQTAKDEEDLAADFEPLVATPISEPVEEKAAAPEENNQEYPLTFEVDDASEEGETALSDQEEEILDHNKRIEGAVYSESYAEPDERDLSLQASKKEEQQLIEGAKALQLEDFDIDDLDTKLDAAIENTNYLPEKKGEPKDLEEEDSAGMPSYLKEADKKPLSLD